MGIVEYEHIEKLLIIHHIALLGVTSALAVLWSKNNILHKKINAINSLLTKQKKNDEI